MSPSDSLINRVKKLLALADNNPNIHEASAAAAKAQELIARHNIQQAFLKAETGDTGQNEIFTEMVHKSGRVASWLVILANAISDANGCSCYYTPGTGIKVVGEADDIALVQVIFCWLEGEVTRLCKLSCSQRGMSKSAGRVFANNFKLGAVAALKERLAEIHQRLTAEVEAMPNGTYALSIIGHKLIRAQAALPKLRAKKFRYQGDSNGYSQGVAAGNRIKLQPDGSRLATR